MSEVSYPLPVDDVIRTLTEIYRHQGQREIETLLQTSHAWFDARHEDWGLQIWALRISIPVLVFASVEPRLKTIESSILEKAAYFNRTNPNDQISEVTITPLPLGKTGTGQQIAPSDMEVRRLWPDGWFRLFLSHVAQHRVEVSKLKSVLENYGVSSFVAHEDIVPSLEWQKEIELGLKSMHALAALITPDFHASSWTDQETGWGLGRGVLVIPVRLGANPYGFMGKIQGISGTLESPDGIASALVNVLLLNPQTHSNMRRAIAMAFCESKSYIWAIALKSVVVGIDDFTDDEKAAMIKACAENRHISGAYYVPDAIYRAFGSPPVQPPQPSPAAGADDVPF